MTQTRKPLFNRTYLWALACFIPAVILLLDASRPQAPVCNKPGSLCTLYDSDSTWHRLTVILPTGLSPQTDSRQQAPVLADAVRLQLKDSEIPWSVRASGFDHLQLTLPLPANGPDAQLTQALPELQHQLQQPLSTGQLAEIISRQQARNYLHNQAPEQQLINNLYNTLSPAEAHTVLAAYKRLSEQPLQLAYTGPAPEFINTLTDTDTLAPWPKSPVQEQTQTIRLQHNGLLLVGRALPATARQLETQLLARLSARRLEEAGIGYRLISHRQTPFGIQALLVREADWPEARTYLLRAVSQTELNAAKDSVSRRYQQLFDIPEGRHQQLINRLVYPQGTPTAAGFRDTLDTFTTKSLQQALRHWLGLAA